MIVFSSLAGLFAAAFIAATLIPFQSEIIFVGLQLAGHVPLWLLIAVASVGNTLGAFVNYAIGLGLGRAGSRQWRALTPDRMARAEAWFRRWGKWALLFSWAPVGDVITVIAGALRTPLWQFAILVALAKTGRYVVLAYLTARLAG
jgi:membrane protein YqaA with SNARE-associated domain